MPLYSCSECLDLRPWLGHCGSDAVAGDIGWLPCGPAFFFCNVCLCGIHEAIRDNGVPFRLAQGEAPKVICTCDTSLCCTHQAHMLLTFRHQARPALRVQSLLDMQHCRSKLKGWLREPALLAVQQPREVWLLQSVHVPHVPQYLGLGCLTNDIAS